MSVYICLHRYILEVSLVLSSFTEHILERQLQALCYRLGDRNVSEALVILPYGAGLVIGLVIGQKKVNRVITKCCVGNVLK